MSRRPHPGTEAFAAFPLVIVDLQHVVASGQAWETPDAATVIARAARLASIHDAPVMATRHRLTPERPGPWGDLARRWAHLARQDRSFELVEELAHLPAHDKTTYSAYGVPAVRDASRAAGGLVVCGVETDCCVAATVFAAVDDGVRVVVVEDAVAGPDEAAHRGALRAFARLPDQVTLVPTSALVGRGA